MANKIVGMNKHRIHVKTVYIYSIIYVYNDVIDDMMEDMLTEKEKLINKLC